MKIEIHRDNRKIIFTRNENKSFDFSRPFTKGISRETIYAKIPVSFQPCSPRCILDRYIVNIFQCIIDRIY